LNPSDLKKPETSLPATSPSEEESADATPPITIDDAPDAIEIEGKPWFADRFVWALFVGALALDQVVKVIVESSLARGESWPVDGFLRFTYARNSGTAFGLFQDQGILLTVISFAALGGMLFYFRSAPINSRLVKIAIGIMIGGAVGNLVDRIRLGYVVDFIDVGRWPIFNLADSFITVGITLLAVITFVWPEKIEGHGRKRESQGSQGSENPQKTVISEGVDPPRGDADQPS
jgi:signal peptidase II